MDADGSFLPTADVNALRLELYGKIDSCNDNQLLKEIIISSVENEQKVLVLQELIEKFQ